MLGEGTLMCPRRPRTSVIGMTRKTVMSAMLVPGLLGAGGATAVAAAPPARPASAAARSGLVSSFTANDGSASEIHGVYVSGTDAGLGVVCIRTPDAGAQAYVFRHVGRAWRYVTSGAPGRTGSTADRRLERVCH